MAIRNPGTTTVTMLQVVPAALASTLGLSGGQNVVSAVNALPHRDARALVQGGYARFGSSAADAADAAGVGSEVRGYQLTPAAGAALAASATVTGNTIALGDRHAFTRARLLAQSTAAASAVIEQAMDPAGPWVRPAAATAVGAGAAVLVETPISAPYVRGVLINGAAGGTMRGYLTVAPA